MVKTCSRRGTKEKKVNWGQVFRKGKIKGKLGTKKIGQNALGIEWKPGIA